MGLRGTIILNVVTSLVSAQRDVSLATIHSSPSLVGGDAFFSCLVNKFVMPNPRPTFFTSLSITRETKKSETLIKGYDTLVFSTFNSSTLVMLELSENRSVPRLTTFFPPSKRWTATNESKDLYTKQARLILTLTDFQCEDAGVYTCVLAVENKADLFTNTGTLTASVPPTIDLSFAPHNGTDEHSSINEIGDNVTFTCNVTGPPNIEIVWKFANLSSVEKVYQENGVKKYSENKWNTFSGCGSRSQTSVLEKTLQKSDNGTKYYCTVTDINDKEMAREQFTIWIHKNIGVRVSTMIQSLVMFLFMFSIIDL